MKIIIAGLLCLLAGCTQSTADLPAPALADYPHVIQVTEDAWWDLVAPIPDSCVQAQANAEIHHVNRQQLHAACGYKGSSYLLGCFTPPSEGPSSKDPAFIWVDGDLSSDMRQVTVAEEWLHLLLWCSGLEPDGDKGHENELIWEVVLPEIEVRLGLDLPWNREAK